MDSASFPTTGDRQRTSAVGWPLPIHLPEFVADAKSACATIATRKPEASMAHRLTSFHIVWRLCRTLVVAENKR